MSHSNSDLNSFMDRMEESTDKNSKSNDPSSKFEKDEDDVNEEIDNNNNNNDHPEQRRPVAINGNPDGTGKPSENSGNGGYSYYQYMDHMGHHGYYRPVAPNCAGGSGMISAPKSTVKPNNNNGESVEELDKMMEKEHGFGPQGQGAYFPGGGFRGFVSGYPSSYPFAPFYVPVEYSHGLVGSEGHNSFTHLTPKFYGPSHYPVPFGPHCSYEPYGVPKQFKNTASPSIVPADKPSSDSSNAMQPGHNVVAVSGNSGSNPSSSSVANGNKVQNDEIKPVCKDPKADDGSSINPDTYKILSLQEQFSKDQIAAEEHLRKARGGVAARNAKEFKSWKLEDIILHFHENVRHVPKLDSSTASSVKSVISSNIDLIMVANVYALSLQLQSVYEKIKALEVVAKDVEKKMVLLNNIITMRDFSLFIIRNFDMHVKYDPASILKFFNAAIDEAINKNRSYDNISAATYEILAPHETGGTSKVGRAGNVGSYFRRRQGVVNSMQVCFDFQSSGCFRQNCKYLHVCQLCRVSGHGKSVCVLKNQVDQIKSQNYNLSRVKKATADHNGGCITSKVV